MLSCKDERRGFFTYECVHCGITKTVYFGATVASARIVARIPPKRVIHGPPPACHVHGCSLPIVRSNRFLPKVLMDTAIAAMLIDTLFKKYRNGFYVHLPKESRITNKRRIARYVVRYIRHPALANTRLHRYDGKSVTFWYKDCEGERHFVKMKVRE